MKIDFEEVDKLDIGAATGIVEGIEGALQLNEKLEINLINIHEKMLKKLFLVGYKDSDAGLAEEKNIDDDSQTEL